MDEDRVVDICFILGIIAIIVLKLTNIITLSWFWLLCPLWGLAGLGIIFCVIITIAYIIKKVFIKIKEKK